MRNSDQTAGIGGKEFSDFGLRSGRKKKFRVGSSRRRKFGLRNTKSKVEVYPVDHQIRNGFGGASLIAEIETG